MRLPAIFNMCYALLSINYVLLSDIIIITGAIMLFQECNIDTSTEGLTSFTPDDIELTVRKSGIKC